MAINVKIAPLIYLDRKPINGTGDSRMAANVILTDIHRLTTVAEPRLPLLTDFGNASSTARVLPCIQAGVISARSAENSDSVVIKTSFACAGMTF